jgi:hypothetical protein
LAAEVRFFFPFGFLSEASTEILLPYALLSWMVGGGFHPRF